MKYPFISIAALVVFTIAAYAQVDPFAPNPEPDYVPPSTSFNGMDGPLTGMEFVTIQSGSFIIGSPSSESGRDDDEGPCRTVNIDSFQLMTTEVTQGMWMEIMGSDHWYYILLDSNRTNAGEGFYYPMYNVSWFDCQSFISRLNELDSGHIYRLPTETEWEYACRAASSTRYYWGDTGIRSEMDEYCWYESNADSDEWTKPHAPNAGVQPVASKSPNAWGLYDMCGNVSEWCEDVYSEDYSLHPIDGSAYIGVGYGRVIRGGNWFCNAQSLRSASRSKAHASNSGNGLGFRVVRTAVGTDSEMGLTSRTTSFTPSISVDVIDTSKDMSFVFIPFPYPSDDILRRTIEQIDLIIEANVNSTEDNEAVFIRAPYADPENLVCIETGEWCGPDITEMERRYSWHERNGYLRIVDDLGDRKGFDKLRFTPQYFFFMGEELMVTGNIVDLVEELQALND